MKYLQFKEICIFILLSLILFFSSINSLPVLDRDEARYVQASKQMIESNNYSSIKFQNEYRSKKPIGIYWLQALSVNLLADVKEINSESNQIVGGDIWKYRIATFNSLSQGIDNIAKRNFFLIGYSFTITQNI